MLAQSPHIPCSYLSRVSNAIVFAKAGVQPFSKQLLDRQLVLLGRVAHSPAGSPLRESTFVDDTLLPQVGRYVRRVGRPRQDWCSEVLRHGAQKLGQSAVERCLKDRSDVSQKGWMQKLRDAA